MECIFFLPPRVDKRFCKNCNVRACLTTVDLNAERSVLQRNSISPAEREKYRPRSTPDPQHDHLHLSKKMKKEHDKDIGHVSI